MQLDSCLEALHGLRVLSQLNMCLALVNPGPETALVKSQRKVQVLERVCRSLQLQQSLGSGRVEQTAVLQFSYRLQTDACYVLVPTYAATMERNEVVIRHPGY